MNKNMFTQDQLAKLAREMEAQHVQQAKKDKQQILHGPSRRSRRHKKRGDQGKHTRTSRTNDGRRFTWHETKELPEDIKAKNRKKNKATKKQKQRARKK